MSKRKRSTGQLTFNNCKSKTRKDKDFQRANILQGKVEGVVVNAGPNNGNVSDK